MSLTSDQFEQQAQALYPALYRRILRLVGDRDLAEDVLQEVLLQGWQARGQLRDQNRLAGWLMAIATRMALTAAQARQQRRGRWLALDETGLAGSAPGTAESVEFAEEVQAAWAALATLAPRQRAAFVLCSVEGCTVAQAAACLGITAGAVKRHLSRARNQLRRRLAPYWNEEEDA